MKKNKIIFITAAILTAFLFSSCFNAVFYNIRQDVFPEESTVKGVINTICRYTINGEEYLFLAAENGLRYKLVKTSNERSENKSSWKSFPKDKLPFTLHKYTYYGTNGADHEGQTILKVLADKDTLYLVTTDYAQDFDEGYSHPNNTYIWAAKFSASENGIESGAWTEIKFDTNIFPYTYSSTKKLYFSHFNVFSTNSINPDNRKVFVRGNSKGGKAGGDCYYELSGLESPKEIFLVKNSELKDYAIAQINESATASDTSNVDSAAYLGDALYFFDSIAVTTNECYKTDPENETNIIYNKPSIIYFAQSYNSSVDSDEDYHPSSKYLKYFTKDGVFSINNDNWTDGNCGEAISSLAVTSDYILIGRGDYSYGTSASGGIVKASLDENGIPVALTSFSTNASIQLSYSYQILTLLVTDPSKKEEENIIYSSITFKGTGASAGTSFDNIGLWAYYPERKNWNCE